MKALLAAISIPFVVVVSTPLAAQEGKAPANAAAFEEQLKATRPGPEHEQLARYAGSWDVEVKLGGGPAAMVYRGAADSRMIVGGRFLQIEYRGQGTAGNTEGSFIVGFDSRHKRHAIVALDNFGTYFVTSQGKRDEATGKIKMYGTDDDPLMKKMGLTKEFAHVLLLRSPDQFAIEVWVVDTRTPARKEMKYVEYLFQRKK
jgi:hypothetical protein